MSIFSPRSASVADRRTVHLSVGRFAPACAHSIWMGTVLPLATARGPLGLSSVACQEAGRVVVAATPRLAPP